MTLEQFLPSYSQKKARFNKAHGLKGGIAEQSLAAFSFLYHNTEHGESHANHTQQYSLISPNGHNDLSLA